MHLNPLQVIYGLYGNLPRWRDALAGSMYYKTTRGIQLYTSVAVFTVNEHNNLYDTYLKELSFRLHGSAAIMPWILIKQILHADIHNSSKF